MRQLLMVIAVGLGAGVARADNGLLSVGAGVSRNNLQDAASIYGGSVNSTDWKVWAGLRPISFLGVEADYLKLGSGTGGFVFNTGSVTSAHLEYKAFAVYGVGFLPIPVPFLDVFGKVGLARWTSTGDTFVNPPGPSSSASVSDSGSQLAWGVGGQLHVSKLGARLEYESFNVPNTNGAHIVSLSVFLNFF